MIKNQLVTLLFMAFAVLTSCNNDDKITETKLHEQVMDVHNEIMPKMAEINRLKRQLISYNKTIPDDSVALRVSVLDAIKSLSKSEDLMSDWMSNYKYPNQEAKHEELIQYLKAQKDTITSVSNSMFMSLATAQGFLKKMPDAMRGESEKTDKK
jgi:hypothetical protein